MNGTLTGTRADINRVAVSKPANCCKINERENSKGTRGQHPRVCYLHLRRRIFENIQMTGTVQATASNVLTS